MIEGFSGSCSTLLEYQKSDSSGSLHQYICNEWTLKQMVVDLTCDLEMDFWVTNLKTATIESRVQLSVYDLKISFFPLINIKFPLHRQSEKAIMFFYTRRPSNHKFYNNTLQCTATAVCNLDFSRMLFHCSDYSLGNH